MIAGGSGEEALTEGELRELLGEEGTDDRPAPAAESGEAVRSAHQPSVLFVSRDGNDARLLRSRLEAHGARVTSARNPFKALDRLRAQAPDAVVSDLDLWAEDGALLFERISRGGRRTPVLFLSQERDRERTEARALRAGAWGVLFAPAAVAEIELAALRLVDATAGAESPDMAPAERRMEPPGPRPSEDARSAAPPRESMPAAAPPVAELGWLRFHFEASRVLREPRSRLDRAGAVLRAAREALLPQAAGIFLHEGHRSAALFETPRDDLGAPALLAFSEGEEALSVSFGSPDRGGRLVLLGLDAAARAAARRYSIEVAKLLDAGLSEK